MTPEKVGAAIVGALALIGGVAIMLGQLWKKMGFGKCADVCPEPDCKAVVTNTHDKVIKLVEGQSTVTDVLERKRKKIEGLQTDTTEIKTDVKWIVRELQKRNAIR